MREHKKNMPVKVLNSYAFRQILRKTMMLMLLSGVLISAKAEITEQINPENANSTSENQQSTSLKGTVIDFQGEPLLGTIVTVKDRNIRTVTDDNGNFTLDNVRENDVITFNLLGMKDQEVVFKGEKDLRVTMYEDIVNLEGVTVIGYSTIKKKDVTGAVVTIGADKIARIPANDLRASLVGIPGVRINGDEIRIRGNRSMKASNDPLIILDGMHYYEPLQSINPEDVESLDILKDASSTALYGPQGANGVIIITTKKAKEGKTIISYDGLVGIGKMNYLTYNPMNADEYVAFKREANRGTGKTDANIFQGNEYANIGLVDADWVDEYFSESRAWVSQTVNIASAGAKTQYKVAFNYKYEDGRLDGVYNDKYYITTDLAHQVLPIMKMGISNRFYYNKNKNKPDPLGSLLQMSPLVPIYNEDGSLNENMGDPAVKNPYLSSNDDYYDDKSENWKAFIKAYVLFDIMDGLTFRSNLSYNQIFYAKGQYVDNRAPTYKEAENKASINNNRGTDIIWNNILAYKKTFGLHSIDAFAVYEMQDRMNFDSGSSGTGQDLPAYKWNHMASLMEDKVLTSSFVRSQFISYVGRVQYTYADKYIVTMTGREDGASQLSEGNKWDFFPSFSAGWRVSEESFMKELPFIYNLKLRGGYGVTGNYSVAPYATLGGLNTSFLTFNTATGEVHYSGLEPGIRPTPDLVWEKTKMLNIGLDVAIMKGRVSATFDYYKSKTDDLLNQKTLPYTSGFDKAWENVGRTQNEGIEIALATVPIETKDLRWELNLSYYQNKEKLVELYDSKLDKDVYNKWWVGYPIKGIYYDYKQVGIWQQNEADLAKLYGQEPGQVKVKDLDGNGKIDSDDLMILGTNLPKWSGALQTSLYWKHWDFNMDIYGEFGALAHDGYSTTTWAGNISRGNTVNVDYWTPENPSNRHPRPVTGQTIQYLTSTGYYDNDFIDLRNVTLGYTFSRALMKDKINKLRLYISVNNPYRYWEYESKGGVTFRETIYMLGVNFQL